MTLGQRLMLLEKRHYPFRRWPKERHSALLFLGCNFPGHFPRTAARLEALCRAHGVGAVYDCCGKPLADGGDSIGVSRSLLALTQRLERLGAARLYTVCPNCAAYLAPRLPIPVGSVYALLAAWGWKSPAPPPNGRVFLPCPDRAEGRWLKELGAFWPVDGLRPVERVGCCGLRHDIAAHGPKAGDALCARVAEQLEGEPLYTYCASCSGQFARHGCTPVRHLLPYLLGVEEAPDCAQSFLNRARAGWRPRREGETP